MSFPKLLRVIAITGLWAVLFSATTEAKTKLTSQAFGKLPDGTPVEIFTLSDGKYEARIATYGGVVVSLKAPDRNGKVADVVLGFDDVDAVGVAAKRGRDADFDWHVSLSDRAFV